jgi:hypothetical protein
VSGLEAVGFLITLVETFPRWGPVLALVAVVLLCQAVRGTWGTQSEDRVPAVLTAVSGVGDSVEDTPHLCSVTCEDAGPRVSDRPGTGGG